jgi:hypothetical protein
MTLPHALGTYPYFVTGVLWFCGLLLAVRSLGFASHRRLIVRAGLIMVPNSLFSLAHWDYWNPVRVGGWPLGPEDALFAFNVGAMGCLAVLLFSRSRLIVADQPVPHLGRLLAAGIPAQCAFVVAILLGRSSMTSTILVQLLAVVALLLLRPDLWQFSAAGAIVFSPIYFCIVEGVFWIWPRFVSCWTSAPPWGLRWFGTPLGEIAWAISFGLFWPLFAAFAFDLRLCSSRPSGQREADSAGGICQAGS